MEKRNKNEREFNNWEKTAEGGRIYWKDIQANDKSKKFARYEKFVDHNEKTVSFTQKIFDTNKKLIEVHEKYPIDKGHIILGLALLLTIGIGILNFL